MIKMNVLIRQAIKEDLDQLFEIETNCFPKAERESKKVIKMRIKYFQQGFLVAEINNSIVGMINCATTNNASVNQREFEKIMHSESKDTFSLGKNHFIISLEVLPEFRGKGISTLLINKTIENAKNNNKKKVLLVCKEPLINYYKKFGFNLTTNKIKYAGKDWFEMKLVLIP